jgi:pimeloyl-ACP methyl ester carboxylesterase
MVVEQRCGSGFLDESRGDVVNQSEPPPFAFRWRRRSLRTTALMLSAAALLAAYGSSPSAMSRTGKTIGTASRRTEFAKRVDIGGGRKMYLECRGDRSPTVVLVSGLDAAADLWHRHEQPAPKVFPEVAKFTRVCAYDRPGTPYGTRLPSRSDPVPQPTTTRNAVGDLHALLRAAHVPGPYALVGHSFGGLLTRLYASTYPKQVSGMVLVDILSDSLRDAMTPEEWTIWKAANARRPQDIAEYPDLERIDFDVAMDQVKAAQRIRPIPLVVLSADVPFGLVVPAAIDKGDLPPNTPRDFGCVIDRANKVAQAELAKLVPGAKHVTKTHSGHNIMIDQPQLVIDAIREIVDAVRRGDRALSR